MRSLDALDQEQLWGFHMYTLGWAADDDDEYGGFASSVESMSCEVLCAALVYRGRLVKKVLSHAGSGVWWRKLIERKIWVTGH